MTRFQPALPLALFLLAPLAAPQGGDPLTKLVDTQFERADETPADRLWQGAMNLREADRTLGDGRLDALLDERLERIEQLTPNSALLAIAARLGGNSPDLPALAGDLEQLVDRADAALASEAFEFLARPVFRNLPRSERSELATRLLERCRDSARPGEVRIAAAMAVYSLGGSERRQARNELLDFLASSDPGTRGLAALGLAEIDEPVEGQLAEELRSLEALPGDAASIASAYLKLETIKRLRDSKLREIQEQLDEQVLPSGLARVQSVLRMIEERHLEGELYDRDQLIDFAMNGMLRALDEHSTYMTPEIFGDFQQDLDAEYGGIGAYVGVDPADNIFTITRPIYSGPAYRAGLMTDDKIVRIGDWPTLGETSEDIIKRLKGKPGTDVKLYIWRRGMNPDQIDRPTEEMSLIVKRARIEIPAAHYQLLPGGIGLVELTTFSRVAASELAQAITDMSQEGLSGLVLDLRRNSGGLLSEAVRVTDLFLPEDVVVVQTEYRGEPTQQLRTSFPALIDEDLPLVVLTSRFTASASEIVSGALQDHGRATLVGERTFGKGSVQNLMPLSGSYDDQFDDENNNGRFDTWEKISYDFDSDGEFDFAPRVKMTIARYLLPSGRSIHRELDKDGSLLAEGGVRPDIEVYQPRIDAWRFEERLELRSDQVARKYVNERWEAHQDLFVELAESDYKETERWPGFAELYASLNTPLPEDDVRQLLRVEVRRRVQDARGGEFPIGDFQEDPQVQEGLRQILAKSGRTADQYEVFAKTFEDLPADGNTYERAIAAATESDLKAVVERIRQAGDSTGTIAPEDIGVLLDALGYTDGR